MSRGRDLRPEIAGYNEIINEIAVCRKYGHDYRNDRGLKAAVINRLHPRIIDFAVSDIIEETPNVKTFRLVPKNGYLPPFIAGQYINLYAEIQGVRTSRPYSISSSPRQRAYYDITVARVGNGFFSDYLLDKVNEGDSFQSSSPSGQFYFNPVFHSKNSVFIAGGSGITPFMSMIREICDAGLDRNVTIFYGNRNEQNAIFHNELISLSSRYENIKYIPVFSEPSSSGPWKTGLIDEKCISEEIKSSIDRTFYICGPEAMYNFCIPQLQMLNIPSKHLRREMFSSASDITKEQGWPSGLTGREEFTVTVRGFKQVKAKSGETLLASLERAGIVVPVNCRCGECSICRVKLVSGKVFQPRGVHLRASDFQYGYVHSCKCYPLGDLEIIL